MGIIKDVENLTKRVDKVEENETEIFGRLNTIEVDKGMMGKDIEGLCRQLHAITTTLEKWLNFLQSCFWKAVGAIGLTIVTLIGVIWYLLRLLINLPT